MRGSKNNSAVLRGAAGLTIGLAAIAAAPAMADDVIGVGQSLQEMYPGVRTLDHDTGAKKMFYGVPMTTGATAQQAAANFLAEHGDEFGVGELTLSVAHETTIRDGKFTAFLYTQTIDGLPVHMGMARVLVLDRGIDHAVVYAAGNLANNAAGDLSQQVFVGDDQALALVRNDVRFANFVNFSQPELVAFFGGAQGEQAGQTRPAWRITTEHAGFPIVDEAYEVFVDAETGEQLLTQSVISHIDVEGTVSGMATPGILPDSAGNPPTEQRLPLLQVMLSGGASAQSDLNGDFVIPHSGTSSVTVQGTLTGPWVAVSDTAGADISASDMVTPPGPAELLFNESPAQFTTAQVNAFLHTNLTYDFMKSRAPGFTGLDRQTDAYVNINDSCNAFFDPRDLSINFFRSGGGCVNTAFSSVVAHEYGHFIVNRLGLGQGSFGEGYGDSVAINLYDTGIMGQGFFVGGGAVRNPEAARQQYPCSSAIHTCGQVLGGTWRWIRLNMDSTLGSAAALDRSRDLFVAWSMITTGGSGNDAAGPWTAVEVLTVDDDDGVLGNGTPNYDEICMAFDRHGIECPELDLIGISVVEAPETLGPGESGEVRVRITDSAASFEPGTQQLGLIIDGDTQFVPLVADGDEFVATIPGQPGLTDLAYFVTADADTGDTVRVPSEGGFPVLVGEVLLSLDFETADGWTVENTSLSDGGWDRGVPLGAGDDRDQDPPTDYDGSGQAFLTDRASGNSDVDGGPTILVSPVFDLSAYGDAIISYARWFQSVNGDPDTFVVQFSDDGGSSWNVADSTDHDISGWIVVGVRVSDVVDVTDEFRVRFIANDTPNDSVTEAGIDAFAIIVDGGSACRADFDGDGSLSIFDFLAFQNAFDAGDLAADFDGDGSLSIFDFLAFQNEFDAGC
ncbi:MAG: GC-type dockerin domain-anchored protein [Phycisphaerales bacterium JB064]